MLNADEKRCDALIICPDAEDVLHVPLSSINPDQVSALQKCMQKVRKSDVFSTENVATWVRKVIRVPDTKKVDREYVLAQVLEKLWTSIIKPVLDAWRIQVSSYSRVYLAFL